MSPATASTAMPRIFSTAVVVADPSTKRLPTRFTIVAATIAAIPSTGTRTGESCSPNGRSR